MGRWREAGEGGREGGEGQSEIDGACLSSLVFYPLGVESHHAMFACTVVHSCACTFIQTPPRVEHKLPNQTSVRA